MNHENHKNVGARRRCGSTASSGIFPGIGLKGSLARGMLVAGLGRTRRPKESPGPRAEMTSKRRSSVEQAMNEKSHRPANTMTHQDLVKLWVVGDLVLPLGMMSDLWLVSGGLDLSG